MSDPISFRKPVGSAVPSGGATRTLKARELPTPETKVQAPRDTGWATLQQIGVWALPGSALGALATSVKSLGSEPKDCCTLFADTYMRTLVGQHFQGENTPALRDTMRTLFANPTGPKAEAALKQLATLRGRPLDELKAEFGKFLQLKQAAATRGYKLEPLNEAADGGPTSHPTFMGATNQLRYGKMVGDALGIDPVFGALLNPTGGLIGPGNVAVEGGDSAVSYHAIVHDAAGYLFNAQGKGPGYDYLGLEKRDTSSPLSGLRAGLKHWTQMTGAKDFSTLTEATITDAVVGGIDTLQAAWTSMRNAF